MRGTYLDPEGKERESLTIRTAFRFDQTTTPEPDSRRSDIGAAYESAEAMVRNSSSRTLSLAREGMGLSYDVVVVDSRGMTMDVRGGPFEGGEAVSSPSGDGYLLTINVEGLEGARLEDRMEEILVHEFTEIALIECCETHASNKVVEHEKAERVEEVFRKERTEARNKESQPSEPNE